MPTGLTATPRGPGSPPLLRAALAVWLAVWWIISCTGPARAFTFTPQVALVGGYNDNVRLTDSPRADFFFSVEPSLAVESGPPTSHFYAAAKAVYTEYLRLNELSRFEGWSAVARYTREPSRNWRWSVWDRYSASYDPVVLNQEGELELVREDAGRRDANTVGGMVRYAYDLQSALQAEYSYTTAFYTEDDRLDTSNHHAKLQWEHRYNQDWRTLAWAQGYHDIYEQRPSIYRLDVGLTVFRMMGPTTTAFLNLAYQEVRMAEKVPADFQSQEYRQYTVGLGVNQKLTPVFEWSAMLGWSKVADSELSELNNNQNQPVASFSVRYEGATWQAGAYASGNRGEYNVLNENRGPAYTYRAGAYYNQDLSRRARFSLTADWLRVDYQLPPASRPFTGLSDENAVVLGATFAYETSRWSTLSLEYRYINQELEEENIRSQNRFLVRFIAYREYR